MHFNQTLPSVLIVDASPTGLGAILAQVQPDDSIRPVSYASRTLTKTERNYSQIEREALAVRWGCKRFHMYLYGSHFTVQTDHKPLDVLLKERGHPSARILKWSLELQSYNFTIKHIAGKNNPADILSRQSLRMETEEDSSDTECCINSIIANAVPKAVTFSQILNASRENTALQKVQEALKTGKWDKNDEDLKPFYKMRHQLTYKAGLILKKSQIVIPETLRLQILNLAHEGHQGITKTKILLREKVWWPLMETSRKQN